MTTTILSHAPKQEQKTSRRRVAPPPIEKAAKSERFAIANREWYPGLRAYYAERTSVGSLNICEAGVLSTKKTPLGSNPTQPEDRSAIANQEWFPHFG